MESASTVKRFRSAQNISIPTIRHKRKFDLPHKFPSKIPVNNALVKGKTGMNVVALNDIKGLKDKEESSIGNITKLRIRSQDGKDLGEVKVQFLSQNYMLNTKTITFSKASVNHRINKPITFSVVPPFDGSVSARSESTQNDSKKSRLVSDHPEKSLEQPEIRKTINKNQKQYKLSEKYKEYSNKLDNVQIQSNSNSQYVTLHKNKMLTGCKSQSDIFLTRKSGESSDKEKDTKNEIIKNQCKIKLSEIQNGLGSERCNRLTELKFPLARCEELPGSTINKISSTNTSTGKPEINLNSKNGMVKEDSKLEKNVSTGRTNYIRIASRNQEKINGIIKNKNNIIRKPEYSNRNVSATNNKYSNYENERIVDACRSNPCRTEIMHNNKEKETESTTDKTKENTDQKKLFEHWDIIKEALTSVKDEELRTKALQALADCRIGIGKRVPIKPVEQLRTVHDSQTQTNVFGLLESDNFIFVKEDNPVLERIKQTAQSNFSCTVDAVTQTQTQKQKQVESELTVNKNIDNISLFPCLTPMSMQNDFSFNIDDYCNEYFVMNPNVSKVKKVLSTPYTLYKRISTQLQADYDGIQQWDNLGMLNIHRAVVNDQLLELQRLLLVLEAFNTSIDVPTRDGLSCLELAIKSNSSEEIIKLLLRAGANPISSELLHDSAVLLASKYSSPLLPELLKYVTEVKLLNRVDAIGFAPLHYCVLNNFIEGVQALIEIGVDVNLKDNRSGRTAFFHALENEYVSIAQKLLENGAIAGLPNFSGQNVLSLIDETKCLSIKALLKHIIAE